MRKMIRVRILTGRRRKSSMDDYFSNKFEEENIKELENIVFERTAIIFGEVDAWQKIVMEDIDEYWQGLMPLSEVKSDFDYTLSLFDSVKDYNNVDHDFLEKIKIEFRNEVMKAIYQRGIDYEAFMNAKKDSK